LESQLRKGLPDQEKDEASRRLTETLLTDPDPNLRDAAAYGLSWKHGKSGLSTLLAVLENTGEHAAVRGTAAEGIGVILGPSDRRRAVYKRASKSLIEALRDESPKVRFWACYALGVMRAQSALEALKTVVANDESVYERWWSVRDEAADAISHINGIPTPHRERITR